MFLAGDVGGTKTRLGLFSLEGGRLKLDEVKRFESAKFPHLAEIVREFLAGRTFPLQAACFGVPGPVKAGTVKVTNLPWTLSERDLSEHTGIPRVRLVNDLVSTAAAIPNFGPTDVHEVYPGERGEDRDVFAIVAPGTGLGHAVLYRENGRMTFLASEAGHANFAPVTGLEVELHAFLSKKFHPVSVERVLCGPGIANIYEFLRDTGKEREEPEVAERMAREDRAAVIAEFARSGKSPLCARTLELFISVLGAHAANIAVTFLSTGGIYLGGGIPPKLIDLLSSDRLVSAYLDRLKLQDVVKMTPIYIIKDDNASLNGAGQLARLLAEG
jgi:glucokinase